MATRAMMQKFQKASQSVNDFINMLFLKKNNNNNKIPHYVTSFYKYKSKSCKIFGKCTFYHIELCALTSERNCPNTPFNKENLPFGG